MTKAVFDSMSDDEAFNLCFPGVNDKDVADEPGFDINKLPYILGFRKGSKYGNCKYCDKYNCSGCKVPYDAETTVEECLRLNDHVTNETLFGS